MLHCEDDNIFTALRWKTNEIQLLFVPRVALPALFSPDESGINGYSAASRPGLLVGGCQKAKATR